MAEPLRLIDPDPGSVVREWLSPGFTTPEPDVRNPELMPHPVRAMMRPCLDTRQFPPGTARLYRLTDVFVVGEGLVFDQDLRLISPSMTQHGHPEAERGRAVLGEAITAGTVVEDPGPMLLCQKRGMLNFGHWLVELLPLAFLCLPQLRADGWSVLVPGGSGAMASVIDASMRMIGVPDGAVRHGTGAPRHAEELFLLHGLTCHGYVISPLVMDCMDALMAGIPASDPGPVWVSRGGAVRRLWNEGEVERVLTTMGWRILEPETLDLRQQVAAFRAATAVAGVQGAGLTGIVFAHPGTRVTSFAPAAMPDTFFWLLSVLRHHRYTEVRAPHDRGWAGDAEYDAPLVLSLPQILQHLGAR